MRYLILIFAISLLLTGFQQSTPIVVTATPLPTPIIITATAAPIPAPIVVTTIATDLNPLVISFAAIMTGLGALITVIVGLMSYVTRSSLSNLQKRVERLENELSEERKRFDSRANQDAEIIRGLQQTVTTMQGKIDGLEKQVERLTTALAAKSREAGEL